MTAPPDTLAAFPVTDSGDDIFPVLTDAQVARFAQHGHRRKVEVGEVLVDIGATVRNFYVVLSGAIEGVQLHQTGGIRVRTLHAGQFSGEIAMLSGRPSLITLRVCQNGELLEMDRDTLLDIIQTDAELSEILVRAFRSPR